MTENDKQHAGSLALQTWPKKLQKAIAVQVGCAESLVLRVARGSQEIQVNYLIQPASGASSTSVPVDVSRGSAFALASVDRGATRCRGARRQGVPRGSLGAACLTNT